MVEEFVSARAGLGNIDGGEDSLFCEGAVEAQFHVSGAFKLFEDDVVHSVLRFDEGRGDDGEASAFGGVACGAEELFGFDERFCVEAAGHNPTFSGLEVIVTAGEAGNRVEEDDDGFVEFNEALSAVEDHLGHLGVALRIFVEGGAVDFCVYGTSEVSDFFGTFVDEENDEGCFWVVFDDGLRDVFEKDRLSCTRRCDDEGALSFAERCYEIDGSRTDGAGTGIFEDDALVGVGCGEAVEVGGFAPFGGGDSLDGKDFFNGEKTLAIARCSQACFDLESGFETKGAVDVKGNLNILRDGAEVVALPAKENATLRADVGDGFRDERGAGIGVGGRDINDKMVTRAVGIEA